jgi:hypothetical protein
VPARRNVLERTYEPTHTHTHDTRPKPQHTNTQGLKTSAGVVPKITHPGLNNNVPHSQSPSDALMGAWGGGGVKYTQPTGMVELVAESVTILNTVVGSLPFKVTGTAEEEAALSEEARLKHRVLDLRRPRMVRATCWGPRAALVFVCPPKRHQEHCVAQETVARDRVYIPSPAPSSQGRSRAEWFTSMSLPLSR